MAIAVTEYTESMIPEVVGFNKRLKEGGAPDRFPASHIPSWLPRVADRKIYQQFFLARDEGNHVRGAYVLKHQEFWIDGKTVSIADFHFPISEGVVNRSYPQVGVQLLLDAQQRQPLLYGMGMGGDYGDALPRLLKAAGWKMFSVPFFYRILHPVNFLRNVTYLRRSALRRRLLDLLAITGLGWIVVKGAHALCYRGIARDNSLDVETVDEFSDWADRLWQDCKAEYGMSAVRDAATLRVLYPKEDKRFIRIKLGRRKKVVGWAVLMNTQLSNHRQFGNMRLGSIVDCFSASANAAKVIASARTMLQRQGADLIVSNQSHFAWCNALRAAGFMRGPSNTILATSAKLAELLRASGTENDHIHINRGDGDGPLNL